MSTGSPPAPSPGRCGRLPARFGVHQVRVGGQLRDAQVIDVVRRSGRVRGALDDSAPTRRRLGRADRISPYAGCVRGRLPARRAQRGKRGDCPPATQIVLLGHLGELLAVAGDEPGAERVFFVARAPGCSARMSARRTRRGESCLRSRSKAGDAPGSSKGHGQRRGRTERSRGLPGSTHDPHQRWGLAESSRSKRLDTTPERSSLTPAPLPAGEGKRRSATRNGGVREI
jgi:hypothetical protein